ncbi:MAG: 2TM domain-containing protein [Methanomicrobiaceae archaeon]|nr:2TM domain-containing protein [Methanomicrobiaceae archaeon]
MEKDDSYKRAEKKVAELKGFYSHLTAYIIVNIILTLINLIISPQAIWFYWITIFWGIGIFMHAWNVFGHNSLFGKEWEDKKIQKYMDKEKKN